MMFAVCQDILDHVQLILLMLVHAANLANIGLDVQATLQYLLTACLPIACHQTPTPDGQTPCCDSLLLKSNRL